MAKEYSPLIQSLQYDSHRPCNAFVWISYFVFFVSFGFLLFFAGFSLPSYWGTRLNSRPFSSLYCLTSFKRSAVLTAFNGIRDLERRKALKDSAEFTSSRRGASLDNGLISIVGLRKTGGGSGHWLRECPYVAHEEQNRFCWNGQDASSCFMRKSLYFDLQRLHIRMD